MLSITSREMKYKAVALFILASAVVVTAQDPQFSQFYAAPLYLNPAFAGSTQQGRVGMNYRNQWPGIDANFTTVSAFADFYLEDHNSGIGAIITRDYANVLGLQSINIGLQYAYQLKINDKLSFRPGVQASFNSRNISYSKLIFGDQINPDGSINPTSAENLKGGGTIFYPDLGFGGLLFSEHAWVGISAFHLLTPNQSLVGGTDRLPMKFSAHAGYKFFFKSGTMGMSFQQKPQERSLAPAIQYRHQGQFDQMDLGMYLTLEPITFGLWYRGVPYKKVQGYVNNESLVMSIGLHKKASNKLNDQLHIGYSYDYTISQLGPGSGGAHEFSIIYTWPTRNPRKPPVDKLVIPCPDL